LDSSSKNLIIQNLEKNSQIFKKNYNSSIFEQKAQNISINANNLYFNNITDYLKFSYGAVDSVYLKNLDNEIISLNKYNQLQLDDNEKINQNIADNKIDNTFKLIKNSSLSIIEFIENLNHFLNINETIIKHINEINEQYTISLNNIKKMEYNEVNNKALINKLEELKEYSINYFIKVNTSYSKTKNIIENSLKNISELIEQCATTTYEQINNKYNEIKNDFKPVNHSFKEEKLIEIEKQKVKINGINYIIKTNIDKYLIENEIVLDIISESGEMNLPKVVGKIINKNRPSKIIIDFYLNFGAHCEVKGRRMTIKFNDAYFKSDFIFDSSTNNITINNNIYYDEYIIKNEKYIIKESNSKKIIDVNIFYIPKSCKSTIDGEIENIIVDAKNSTTIEIFEY
jgi:hypothetical protein